MGPASYLKKRLEPRPLQIGIATPGIGPWDCEKCPARGISRERHPLFCPTCMSFALYASLKPKAAFITVGGGA